MLKQFTHDIATPLSRRRWLAATAGLVLGLSAFGAAKADDDTIKVGVLHSLSGTMAISETTLKDTVLFMIDEQNKKGGVLGKKLEAVVRASATCSTPVRRRTSRRSPRSTI
jgi:urea transport system substrate-binding protein